MDPDALAHEIGHIVEGSAAGVGGSPAFPLWQDSKWCEIFQYDMYVGAGLNADAKRLYDGLVQGADDFPKAGTHWFRDWFQPIWRDHGGAKALARFFSPAGRELPQRNGIYLRDLNWGEFVHFWSGAAGVDLQPTAQQALGWPAEWQQQLDQARREFPAVTYAPAQRTARVTFQVRSTPTTATRLYVSGSTPELGSWDPARAVPLAAAGTRTWRTAVALPVGPALEYKYLEKSATGRVTWESGANRRLTPTAPVTLNDTWRRVAFLSVGGVTLSSS